MDYRGVRHPPARSPRSRTQGHQGELTGLKGHLTMQPEGASVRGWVCVRKRNAVGNHCDRMLTIGCAPADDRHCTVAARNSEPLLREPYLSSGTVGQYSEWLIAGGSVQCQYMMIFS
jgi:hypothetical protein